MKKAKFTEAQIAFVLKPVEDGTAIGEVCRKAGISESALYLWRKHFRNGMLSPVEFERQQNI